MTRKFLVALAVLAAAFTAAGPALAQKAGAPLETRLVARKVVKAEGGERLVEATDARPGDVIEYEATYRNTGSGAITGLLATIPVPPQTEYLPGTARPAGAKASLDGRDFADIPLKRTVQREGRRVEEQVPSREYRYLRWSAGVLAGGQTAAFSARVKVIDDRTPSEPGSKGGGK